LPEYINNILFMTNSCSPLKLVLATRNTHKASELKLLLASASADIMNLSAFPDAPSVDESASSLEENAALKALSAHDHTGLWALGDDTGLCIDALDGQPGVRSARFAGINTDDTANRTLVLQMLANETNRSAQFTTILALAYPGGLKYFRGCLRGHIATSEMSTQGFGYESIFVPEGFNISLAQLSREEKNGISHRGHSAAKLLDFLNELKAR
jgi:XTP/dITP diphosphohydrolase